MNAPDEVAIRAGLGKWKLIMPRASLTLPELSLTPTRPNGWSGEVGASQPAPQSSKRHPATFNEKGEVGFNNCGVILILTIHCRSS